MMAASFSSSPARGGGPLAKRVVEGARHEAHRLPHAPSTSRRLVPSIGLTMPRMVKDRPADDPTRCSVPGRIMQ